MPHDDLSQWYSKYGALVHRRCRTLMGNEADANDALVPGKGRKTGAPIIGTWSDTFVRTPEGWRFKDRRGQATMHAG